MPSNPTAAVRIERGNDADCPAEVEQHGSPIQHGQRSLRPLSEADHGLIARGPCRKWPAVDTVSARAASRPETWGSKIGRHRQREIAPSDKASNSAWSAHARPPCRRCGAVRRARKERSPRQQLTSTDIASGAPQSRAATTHIHGLVLGTVRRRRGATIHLAVTGGAVVPMDPEAQISAEQTRTEVSEALVRQADCVSSGGCLVARRRREQVHQGLATCRMVAGCPYLPTNGVTGGGSGVADDGPIADHGLRQPGRQLLCPPVPNAVRMSARIQFFWRCCSNWSA